MRKVFIRDLEVMGSIGIYEQEKRAPQRIVISVDMQVEEREGNLRDDIAEVVSYEDAVKAIEAIVAEGHINLVETLAERIATNCLADPRVASVRVRVEKPDIIANAASVGVEIEWQRPLSR
jgi:dihydroneopterin aldolase